MRAIGCKLAVQNDHRMVTISLLSCIIKTKLISISYRSTNDSSSAPAPFFQILHHGTHAWDCCVCLLPGFLIDINRTSRLPVTAVRRDIRVTALNLNLTDLLGIICPTILVDSPRQGLVPGVWCIVCNTALVLCCFSLL